METRDGSRDYGVVGERLIKVSAGEISDGIVCHDASHDDGVLGEENIVVLKSATEAVIVSGNAVGPDY